MSRFWEHRLIEIREQLLMMSTLTERTFAQAVRALLERDDKLCEVVEANDSQIDALEMHIDEMVMTFMSTHAPTAGDARLMLALTKISSNLERAADEATKIARRSRELNAQPKLKAPVDISAMAEIARVMLYDSISSFVEEAPARSVEIIRRDRSVDAFKKGIERELTEHMTTNPKMISPALNLMTIVRAIERVADHAKNIAEEVFYLYKAENIRHEPSLKTPHPNDPGESQQQN